MRSLRALLQLTLLGFALSAGAAHAALCNVPGRQDATCLGAIASNGPGQPTCPAGQLTVSPSQWQGSSWSSPVCKPAPPLFNAALCQWGSSNGISCNSPPWYGRTFPIEVCDSFTPGAAWSCYSNLAWVSFSPAGAPSIRNYYFVVKGADANGVSLQCFGVDIAGGCSMTMWTPYNGIAPANRRQGSLLVDSGANVVWGGSQTAYAGGQAQMSPILYVPYSNLVNGTLTIWTYGGYGGFAP